MFVRRGKCGHCGVHTGGKAWHGGCPEREHRAPQDVSFPHALPLLQWSACSRKGFSLTELGYSENGIHLLVSPRALTMG